MIEARDGLNSPVGSPLKGGGSTLPTAPADLFARPPAPDSLFILPPVEPRPPGLPDVEQQAAGDVRRRPASLDRHETSVDPDLDHVHLGPAQSFRHAGWASTRRRIYESMVRTGASNSRLKRFNFCGACLWLAASAEHLELHTNGCRDRMCVPCQVAHRERLIRSIYAQHADKALRFVTLTLKHQAGVSLADQIDRLLRSFRALRQRTWWSSRVTGGAWFLEVQRSEERGTWHPHLHILCEGKFLPQVELSKQWHAVTGDSYIVDVQAAADQHAALKYVTKYATKPAPTTVTNNPAALDEFLVTVRGRRLLQAFGSWRKLDDAADDPDVPTAKAVWVGSLWELHRAALRGEASARRWMEAAFRRWPRLVDSFPLPPPPAQHAQA